MVAASARTSASASASGEVFAWSEWAPSLGAIQVRNQYNPAHVRAEGFEYVGIGRGTAELIGQTASHFTAALPVVKT